MTINICRECGGRTGNIACQDGVCSGCLALLIEGRKRFGSGYKAWPKDMKTGDRWLIVGSSPSMPTFLEYVIRTRAEYFDVVATTNAAVTELARPGGSGPIIPNYYAVMELKTPELYGRWYEQLRRDHGTMIVTSSLALANHIDVKPDIVLEITGWADQTGFVRGRYITGGTTGSHLIQLAVNLGAKHVTLIGMEGYRSTPATQVVDSFDGKVGPKHGEAHTRKWYGPLMQQVVSACPDVFFKFYGRLSYAVVGDNVQIVGEKNLCDKQPSPHPDDVPLDEIGVV